MPTELLQIAGISSPPATSRQQPPLTQPLSKESTPHRGGTNPPGGSTGSMASILDGEEHELKLEKSNILMLGPTGSGWYRKTPLCQRGRSR